MEPLFEVTEIHWLRFISAEEDNVLPIAGHSYHYWSSYQCAQELIAKVNPAVLIVMSNDNALSIALIHAAKSRNIPTYYLQHGMFARYQDYKLLERNLTIDTSQLKEVQATKQKHGFSTVRFLKKSLGWRLFAPSTLLYFLVAKIKTPRTAAWYIKDKTRVPHYFLCFSKETAIIHQELDRITDRQIVVVGNPEVEKIMSDYKNAAVYSHKVYWVLIDQPLSGSDIGEVFIDRKIHHGVYLSLADKAASFGAKLYIKLHPGNYNSTDMPTHNNIEWLRNVPDMTSVLKGAVHCIGFFSSLLVPCILTRPVTLIKILDLSFYKRYGGLPNVQLVEEANEILSVPPEPALNNKHSSENYPSLLRKAILTQDD